jgi:hypothetical protein
MPEVDLSAGTIDYQDTGGNGPAVVLLHGLAMDVPCGAASSASWVTSPAAWFQPCRWAATGDPCTPTPTCHPAASPGYRSSSSTPRGCGR